MTARSWFRVHSFTGVITGLLLFVICWSGTFAVLAHEIDWLVTPNARVEVRGERASWGAWLAAVKARYPEAEVRWLAAPLYPAFAAEAVVDLPAQSFVRVYIDPYSGEVLGRDSFFSVQRFFRDFHRRFFYPNPWGLYLVSIFAMTLLASLVAALMFYRRWWRRFFHFRAGGGRALLSALHKTAGLWSLWFVVIMVITGGWYLFEGLRADIGDGKVAYAGPPDSAVRPIPKPAADPAEPPLPLDTLMTRVRQLRPDLTITTVSPSFSHDGALYVDGQAGHVLVRNRANQIHLDRRTGAVLYSQTPQDYSLYWRWADTADPLHFGNFAGLTSKLIWFAFGLVLSGLILTGTWLHARRLVRQAGGAARHRWPGTWAAIAVSLLVLAGSLPFGLEALAFFGPTIDGAKQLPALPVGVSGVILGWIAATLGILAAWTWLLWRPGIAVGRTAQGGRLQTEAQTFRP